MEDFDPEPLPDATNSGAADEPSPHAAQNMATLVTHPRPGSDSGASGALDANGLLLTSLADVIGECDLGQLEPQTQSPKPEDDSSSSDDEPDNDLPLSPSVETPKRCHARESTPGPELSPTNSSERSSFSDLGLQAPSVLVPSQPPFQLAEPIIVRDPEYKFSRLPSPLNPNYWHIRVAASLSWADDDDWSSEDDENFFDDTEDTAVEDKPSHCRDTPESEDEEFGHSVSSTQAGLKGVRETPPMSHSQPSPQMSDHLDAREDLPAPQSPIPLKPFGIRDSDQQEKSYSEGSTSIPGEPVVRPPAASTTSTIGSVGSLGRDQCTSVVTTISDSGLGCDIAGTSDPPLPGSRFSSAKRRILLWDEDMHPRKKACINKIPLIQRPTPTVRDTGEVKKRAREQDDDSGAKKHKRLEETDDGNGDHYRSDSATQRVGAIDVSEESVGVRGKNRDIGENRDIDDPCSA